MSQRRPTPATDTSSPFSLSRRTLFAATAAAVPAGAVVLGSAPALADPSVTDGETRIVDVPLAEVPLVEVDGAQARDSRGAAGHHGGRDLARGHRRP